MSRAVSRRWARIIPVLVVMATIFTLSHQPGDSLQLPSLPGLDKLAHAGVYGGLAAAAIFAVSPLPPTRDRRLIAAAVVAFCLLFGLSDEYHQSFIVGRFASEWDLLADGVGATLVAGAWWRKRRMELTPGRRRNS